MMKRQRNSPEQLLQLMQQSKDIIQELRAANGARDAEQADVFTIKRETIINRLLEARFGNAGIYAVCGKDAWDALCKCIYDMININAPGAHAGDYLFASLKKRMSEVRSGNIAGR